MKMSILAATAVLLTTATSLQTTSAELASDMACNHLMSVARDLGSVERRHDVDVQVDCDTKTFDLVYSLPVSDKENSEAALVGIQKMRPAFCERYLATDDWSSTFIYRFSDGSEMSVLMCGEDAGKVQYSETTEPLPIREILPQEQYEEQISAKLNELHDRSPTITLKSCALSLKSETQLPCQDPRYASMLVAQEETLHLSETRGDVFANSSPVYDGDTALQFTFDPEVENQLDAYSDYVLDMVDRYPSDLPTRFAEVEKFSSAFFAEHPLQSYRQSKYCTREAKGALSPYFMLLLDGVGHENLARDITDYADTYCRQ